jgi:hypothetical protein
MRDAIPCAAIVLCSSSYSGSLHFDKHRRSVPLKKDGRYLKRCLLFHVPARNPVATNTFEQSVGSNRFEATDSVTQVQVLEGSRQLEKTMFQDEEIIKLHAAGYDEDEDAEMRELDAEEDEEDDEEEEFSLTPITHAEQAELYAAPSTPVDP